MNRDRVVVNDDGVIHAVLGNYLPHDRELVQRLCDQRLVTTTGWSSAVTPACPVCVRIVERMEKYMSESVAASSTEFFVPAPQETGENADYDEGEYARFFRDLSEKVRAWSTKNFGDNPSHRQVLGMVEEIAELKGAMETLHRSDAYDAIADIVIYMADYFGKREWDMGETALLSRSVGGFGISSLDGTIGRLSHHHLKCEQGIRASIEKHENEIRSCCAHILDVLSDLAGFMGTTLTDIVVDIWNNKVSKRDWTKNPMNAAEVVDSAATQ